jgi:hypothetical protein
MSSFKLPQVALYDLVEQYRKLGFPLAEARDMGVLDWLGEKDLGWAIDKELQRQHERRQKLGQAPPEYSKPFPVDHVRSRR